MPTESDAPQERSQRLVAIAGARGGAGVSLLATNVSIYLATLGRRVLLVDADVSGSASHALVAAGAAPLAVGVPCDTLINGLRCLDLGWAARALDHPAGFDAEALLASLRDQPADYVVLDLGVLVAPPWLALWCRSDASVFVTVPDPTAIETTYRFLRAVRAVDAQRTVHMVINQTRNRADLLLGEGIVNAAWQHLQQTVENVGHIEFEDIVWSTTRLRQPLLVESPGSRASKSIEKVARRLLLQAPGRFRASLRPALPRGTYHEILGVGRGASEEEIRRSYKALMEVYAPDSLATYGLLGGEALAAFRQEIQQAYDVMLDPARRRPYELSVFPPDEAPQPPRSHAPAEPGQAPVAPTITPTTEFSGELLRDVRRARAASLEDISRTTRIGVAYLRALENEDHSALPAAEVYVRGFVVELAKALGLDGNQVATTYLRRYRKQQAAAK